LLENETPHAIEAQLAQLRRADTGPLPDASHLERKPIALERDGHLWQRYCRASRHLASVDQAKLANRHVAIDLDETLLLNSHACPQLWHLGRGYQDEAIYPAYRYRRMRKTWRGRLQWLRGRTHYDTADRRAYPFLQNPRQIVMPRPGMMAGLAWLARQGLELSLVTSSAPERVAYLFARLPALQQTFGYRVVTAREMAAYYLTLERDGRPIPDRGSRQAYWQRPRSLAIKTPDLVDWGLGNGGYDLIVDDSKRMAAVLQQSELRERLLWVRPDCPASTYGMQIVAAIAQRVTGAAPSLATEQRLQPAPNADAKIAAQKGCSRLEDPYYWPLCHVRDRLPSFPSG